MRVALVATLLTWAADHYATAIVRPLVPAIRDTITLLDRDFQVFGVDVYMEAGVRTLRVRADLAHPVVVGKNLFTPINTSATPGGWIDVRLTLGGLLQYPLLLLIVVMGWPARSMREMPVRLALAMPVMLALFALTVSVTTLAELWFVLRAGLATDEHWPLLLFSRFLMGGGGQALALTCGLIVIGAARRRPHPDHCFVADSNSSHAMRLPPPSAT
jgi:hypothetical protein